MHRIDTPTAQKDKFGAGKNGFTRGNPQTGTPATDLDDDYFDMLQEELAGVVEASGVNLEKSKHNQLLTALKALLLSRAHPFADIKADGAAAIAKALENLGLSDVLKGDDATYAGFENGNVNVPYLRHKPTSAVVHLAKEADLDDLQPLDSTLTAISGKTSAEVLEWLGMGDGHGRLLGVKVFTVSGTYTPDPLMKSCRVRAIGGGGGSGSAANTASGEISVSGGGAAGSYAEAIFTRSQIGASIAATVGAPGAGGVDSNGGTGGATALGGILYCPGGMGSPEGVAASQSTSYLAMPGAPGAPSTTSGTAILLQCGESGEAGMSIGNLVLSGSGGSSQLGAGGALVGFSATGKPGSGYGSGAGGVATQATPSNPGARGAQGVIIIEEYS
ncbi:hypothetical protein CIPOCK429B_05370 [Citrobacter portucalensis]